MLIRDGAFRENLEAEDILKFESFGAHSRVRGPVEVFGPENVTIGKYVSLGRYGKIISLDDFTAGPAYIQQHYPGVAFDPKPFTKRNPKIIIHDGASLGDSYFIAATCHIEIGKHVITSGRLFLTDCAHIYENPDLPVALQGNTDGTPLIIGEGSWLGIGVSVIKGVTIGKHVVVGANSVVNKDIPDYAVVAGAPARIVKMQK